MVRATDQKSPREAVEFVLQLLKYNDNNGNPYSDVFWLAALVQSVGELEFGQQSILFLASLLKRIDRLLQFDRLMPSYNGILTISCIRTLTQIALKLSGLLSLDRIIELIRPFRNFNSTWQVRIEATRALLDLEYHCNGIDAVLLLFIKYLEEEKSLRGQVKLGVHVMRLCQIMRRSDSNDSVNNDTLVALLLLLEGHMAFNNVCLRHYLFCILQVLAGRPPTLYGVPREYKTLHMGDSGTCSEQKRVLTSLIPEFNPPEPSSVSAVAPVPCIPATLSSEPLHIPKPKPDSLAIPEVSKEGAAVVEVPKQATAIAEAPREAASVSNSHERKLPVVKIKVRSSAATSRADADNLTTERSHAAPRETDVGPSSSVSVDAPQRNIAEATSISNHILEEVNSCHDHGSHMTASIGSAKPASYGDDLGKEFQCTADSSRAFGHFQPEDPSSSSIIQDNNIDADAQKYASLQTLSLPQHDHGLFSLHSRHGKKEKKKDKEKKRKRDSHKEHRNDPEYIERKRLKKEKKQKEKEMAKLLNEEVKPLPIAMPRMKEPPTKSTPVQLESNEPSGSRLIVGVNSKPEASEGTASAAPKLRIKFKNRTLNNS